MNSPSLNLNNLRLPPINESRVGSDAGSRGRGTQTRRQPSTTSADLMSTAVHATVGLAGVYYMLVLWSPDIKSPRPADRQATQLLRTGVQDIAQRAQVPVPNAYIHLALPTIRTLAVASRHGTPTISLHPAVFDRLAPEMALCLAGHEMGHLAQAKGAPLGFFKALQLNPQEISSLQPHALEYAADWFGAQACGRDNFFAVLNSQLQREWFPDNFNSSYYTHPLNSERIENLRLSNDSFLHLPQKDFTGLDRYAVKSFVSDHPKELVVLSLATALYLLFKKNRKRNSSPRSQSA